MVYSRLLRIGNRGGKWDIRGSDRGAAVFDVTADVVRIVVRILQDC